MALRRKKGPRRVIVLLVADEHAGNRLGLMNPDVVLQQLDETGRLVDWRPPLGALQSKLWAWFTDDVRQVAELADGCEVIYVHQGDVVQGTKHRTLQVGDREANQLLIAAANQEPILSLPNVKEVRFVAGTAAHDGIGASRVSEVVKVLSLQYPKVHFETLYHGVLNVDGCRVDYAHHGPHPGSRFWLAGNALNWYVRDLVVQDLVRRRDPPRVFTRAHQHAYRHIVYHSQLSGEERAHDGILLPSWCGMQDYAYKVARSAPWQAFGMVALEVVSGELAGVYPFVHELDLRTEECL